LKKDVFWTVTAMVCSVLLVGLGIVSFFGWNVGFASDSMVGVLFSIGGLLGLFTNGRQLKKKMEKE
jgi:hypothetical protein